MTTVAPQSDLRRHELADFLRSRRERITPEQVGLVRGRRRRTPGLRREEVAQLSAVGVTWYTWLEQAREIQVSPQVLDALARALLLDSTERAHLFALADSTDPAPDTRCPSVTPALRAMLDQLDPIPACVQNSRYDILAYNATYARLLCDLDRLPREDRNCLWLAFTNPEWRASLADMPDVNRMLAAKFRASMAGHLAETGLEGPAGPAGGGLAGVPGDLGAPRGGRTGQQQEVHPQRPCGPAPAGTHQPLAGPGGRPPPDDLRPAGRGDPAPAGAAALPVVAGRGLSSLGGRSRTPRELVEP